MSICWDTVNAELKEWYTNRGQRVGNPSKRTSDRSTDFNDADNVERQLQQDNHKIWGWIIYRCTYASDDDWNEFMTRLNFWIREGLSHDRGLDMLDSLDYHVLENKELFEGAHPSTIREHFRNWCIDAPQREQGVPHAMQSQRYNYCIHVDQACVDSVLAAPAPPDYDISDTTGFVNLVCLNTRGGMRPEHTEDRDERDLCWMRISYKYLMVTWYSLFRKQGSWFTEYRVPPEVGRP